MLALLLLLSGAELPSAEPPVVVMREARDLLKAREFARLTKLVQAQESAAEKDPGQADRLDWTLNAFRLEDAAIPGLLDEWVKQAPQSWASLLARAVNRRERAAAARGTKWASETSADQFRRMAELNEAMRADCRIVLSGHPSVCPCYAELVTLAKTDGAPPDPLVGRAFEACPRDLALNTAAVYALTPRWGGSYEQMRAAIEAARRRGVPPEDLRRLEAHIAVDRAWVVEESGKRDEAQAILDEAIKAAATAVLFEERAELEQRRGDWAAALRDANAAIEMSNGGFAFSPRGLSRLLLVRTRALVMRGRLPEARADVDLAFELAPGDPRTREWHESPIFSKAFAPSPKQ